MMSSLPPFLQAQADFRAGRRYENPQRRSAIRGRLARNQLGGRCVMGAHQDEFVVAVEFHGRQGGTLIVPRSSWNTCLTDNRGRPIGQFGARDIDDAVAAAKLYYGGGQLCRLQQDREYRAEAIRRHFRACASKFIEALEATEESNLFGMVPDPDKGWRRK